FGGVLSAGPERLEIAAKKGLPLVVSVGACDMVNFGPKDTVPERYKNRKLFVHNPAVTLMRTTPEENEKLGQFILDKRTTYASNPSTGRVLIPEKGVSMLDAPNKPFYDQAADKVLFDTIDEGLEGTQIQVEKHDLHVNDE